MEHQVLTLTSLSDWEEFNFILLNRKKLHVFFAFSYLSDDHIGDLDDRVLFRLGEDALPAGTLDVKAKDPTEQRFNQPLMSPLKKNFNLA